MKISLRHRAASAIITANHRHVCILRRTTSECRFSNTSQILSLACLFLGRYTSLHVDVGTTKYLHTLVNSRWAYVHKQKLTSVTVMGERSAMSEENTLVARISVWERVLCRLLTLNMRAAIESIDIRRCHSHPLMLLLWTDRLDTHT